MVGGSHKIFAYYFHNKFGWSKRLINTQIYKNMHIKRCALVCKRICLHWQLFSLMVGLFILFALEFLIFVTTYVCMYLENLKLYLSYTYSNSI